MSDAVVRADQFMPDAFLIGSERGEIVAGQYRLVHIGVESVVMEYADGRGRETIRMSGQECVGK